MRCKAHLVETFSWLEFEGEYFPFDQGSDFIGGRNVHPIPQILLLYSNAATRKDDSGEGCRLFAKAAAQTKIPLTRRTRRVRCKNRLAMAAETGESM
jgi:hypothetical protein